MTDLTPAQQALRHLELLGKDPDAAWFRAIKHGQGANSRRDGADLRGFNRDELRSDANDGHALRHLVVGDAYSAPAADRPEPEVAWPKPDPHQIARFLQLLGKPKGTSRLRAFLPKGHPQLDGDKGRKGAGSLERIEQWQAEGRGVYLVIGNGGDTDREISSCPALFIEHDDRPIEWQVAAWRSLGLPEPSMQIESGGRSVHTYWLLDEPMEPACWRQLQERLLEHADADRTIKNPARVMRLPGTWHMGADGPNGMARIITAAGHRYSPEQIAACLPVVAPAPAPAPAAPTPGLADAVPVAQLLPRDQLRAWEQGVGEGQRNSTAFSLACQLLALHEAAAAAGLATAGTPEDALLEFASRCSPPLPEQEVVSTFRSACSAPRTTDPGWPDRLRYHLNRKARQQRVEAQAARAAAAPPPHDDDDAPKQHAPEPIKASNGYYTCLGFDGDGYYYQPHRTGQVIRLSRSSHTATNLCALAPLPYWEATHPGGRSGPNWTAAASTLFEQQATVGVYSPDRIRGRGAWWDQGRAVLHLGDRLVVDGVDRLITNRLPGSPYLYQRLAAIDCFADISPLTDDEAFPLLDLASRFHWEVPASGLLLAGWVTLAPICGALDWRPHAWLTAAAGSGKSAILDRYVGPLLGPIALWPEGNTTEAFIRQELRADALPVVFDEAESNEKRDQERIQSILSLARVASSSGRGVIGKGSADGSSQRYVIRSMFLMSSIATALKQGADRSRFAQLTLRNPAEIPKPQRKAHWEELDRDLDRFITEEIGRRLLMRTIGLIPVIRESVTVFRRVAADHFDSQRLGDQYGTLLAGAWSLMSTEVVTDERARKMITDEDWEPYSQATEVPDERRCIQRILQHQVRVEADERVCSRTLGELVEIAVQHRIDREVTVRQASEAMSRHGLKVDTEQKLLLVSNTAEALASILRDTAWAHSWATVLNRLPGATKAGTHRFSGAGTVSRAVALQIADL